MGELRSKTISGMKWSAIERFSVQGITFLLGLVMARLLTPADYGLIGVLGIFIAVAQTFIDSGFGNALVRKLDRTEYDLNTVFYFNVVASIVCYGILFFIAPAVATFFHQPILKDILRVISVNLVIQSFNSVQLALFQANIDFKAIAKCSLASSIISGIFGIVLAYLGYGVWALVYQQICATVVKTITIWYFSNWRPKWMYSWKSFHTLFAYGSKLLASGLLHTIYVNLTTLFIGRFYSAKALGFYSRGDQFPTLICSNTTGVLQRVTFPIFAKLQNDDKKLVEVYRKYICITSMGLFFLLFLLSAISKPLIVLLLGSKWEYAAIYCQILCFAWMFDHICVINLNLLQVKGRSDLFLRLEIIKKTISFAILCAAVPFGVMAICVSRIIYTQIALIINTYYTGKLFGLGYFLQLKDFGKYFILSLLAVLPAFFISKSSWHPLLIIVVEIIISLCIYMWVLKKNKDVYFRELFSFFVQQYTNIKL